MTREDVKLQLRLAAEIIRQEGPESLVENVVHAVLEIITEKKAIVSYGSVTAIVSENDGVLVEVNPPPCFTARRREGEAESKEPN